MDVHVILVGAPGFCWGGTQVGWRGFVTHLSLALTVDGRILLRYTGVWIAQRPVSRGYTSGGLAAMAEVA